jgi:hypothetical protein
VRSLRVCLFVSCCIGFVASGHSSEFDPESNKDSSNRAATVSAETDVPDRDVATNVLPGSGLEAPVRLEADGKPIDIGKLSSIAHAGPWIADIDADGDRDLLVGDFPGHFWHFDNVGSDEEPRYTSKGKLQAGGKDAKTPVY